MGSRRTLGLSPTLSLKSWSPLWDGDRGLRGLGELLGRQPEAPGLQARPEALQAKSGSSPLGTANNRWPPSFLHLSLSPPQTLATNLRITGEGSLSVPTLLALLAPGTVFHLGEGR